MDNTLTHGGNIANITQQELVELAADQLADLFFETWLYHEKQKRGEVKQS